MLVVVFEARRVSRSRPQSAVPSSWMGVVSSSCRSVRSLSARGVVFESCSCVVEVSSSFTVTGLSDRTSPRRWLDVHSYPHRLKQRTSLPMIFTVGCPFPHPSSSALRPVSRPKLTALEREFALTTACARERRDESGCSGIVKLRSVTANARTRGARFVCKVIVERSVSERVETGRVSEDSSWEGSSGLVEGIEVFVRFEEGNVVEVPVSGSTRRFLETRLAALSRVLACLSSGKMDWRRGSGCFEIASGLLNGQSLL